MYLLLGMSPLLRLTKNLIPLYFEYIKVTLRTANSPHPLRSTRQNDPFRKKTIRVDVGYVSKWRVTVISEDLWVSYTCS